MQRAPSRALIGHGSSTITERLYFHVFDRRRADELVRQAMATVWRGSGIPFSWAFHDPGPGIGRGFRPRLMVDADD